MEELWAQFVLFAGRVNAEVAWTRDKIVVGSVSFRNHFVSIQINLVVLQLVDPFHPNATPNFVGRSWVGPSSLFVQFGLRGALCGIMDLSAVVGERHLSSDCRGHFRPFLLRCHARIVSVWLSCGFHGWFRFPCCCLVSHICRLTTTVNYWAVGTIESWLGTQFLI